MAETRTKVYLTPAEQQADETEAAHNGWVVTERTLQPDGTMRVAYQQRGQAWAGGVVGPAPANDTPDWLPVLGLVIVVAVVVALVLGWGR